MRLWPCREPPRVPLIKRGRCLFRMQAPAKRCKNKGGWQGIQLKLLLFCSMSYPLLPKNEKNVRLFCFFVLYHTFTFFSICVYILFIKQTIGPVLEYIIFCFSGKMWNKINPSYASRVFHSLSYFITRSVISQIPQGIYFIKKNPHLP